MEREAGQEKVELAVRTCISILKNNSIAVLKLRQFVSNILDAIDIVGDDRPFTKPQEEEIVKAIKDYLLATE